MKFLEIIDSIYQNELLQKLKNENSLLQAFEEMEENPAENDFIISPFLKNNNFFEDIEYIPYDEKLSGFFHNAYIEEVKRYSPSYKNGEYIDSNIFGSFDFLKQKIDAQA